MTKAEFVETIAVRANLTKAAAERVLNALLHTVQESLVEESHLTLTGFGTFSIENRKARQGRNPQTGQPLVIPAGKQIRLTAGKLLRESLRSRNDA